MGVKISALPAIVTPALSDVFAVVQAGVTYKESFTQLSSIFATSGANSNITSLSGLTTPLSIAQGGTASATGNPVFGSVSFSSTSGIIGTTTNDNAATGSVGEFMSSVIPVASSVSLISLGATNLTSLALGAGDWDVWGNVTFTPAATTSISSIFSWLSLTSATLPDPSLFTSNFWSPFVPGAGSNAGLHPPSRRFSLAAPATVYISGAAIFTVSTMTFCGGIYARRRR